MDIAELSELMEQGKLTARELTDYFLERIARLDGDLGAFLFVDAEQARAQADRVDAQRRRGEKLGALAGIPIAIKDNLCTEGVPTTCASRILEGYRPPYDADVVARLKAAGAVLLGKLNMDEFAMGSSTENSAYFPTKNPWDLARSPGGSSGGAAAAVAAGLCVAALGSDTGGSVRQPGALCGVTALKPTYGRVSRFGLVAFASSLDQVGPLARSARDAARVLQVIAGHDDKDATSVTEPVDDYLTEVGTPLTGMRIGVLRTELDERCDADVMRAYQSAQSTLASLGCQLVDVELPHLPYGVAAYYLVAPAEASSNLARFDGMRYGLRVTGDDLRSTYEETRDKGFGPEVKRRIMLGTYALSAGYYDAYYLKAQRVRTLIRRDYERVFEKCDAVLSPTAPGPAFRLGEKVNDPLTMYLEDVFTLPPSLSGLPAISTPSGLSKGGLPLGVQFTTPALSERLLVKIADAFERAQSAPLRAPNYVEG